MSVIGGALGLAVAASVRFDVFEANGQIEDIDAMLTPKLSGATARPGM